MPQRLFIAVDLPEEMRQRLGRLLAESPGGVKPVRPEQMHLTLHFLGDVEDGLIVELAAALEAIEHPGFTIDVAGGGCFPSPRRPNVLWIGAAVSEPLAMLHAALAEVLTKRGFAVETRPFTPHITLARVSRRLPAGWVEAFLATTARVSIAAVPVAAFTLYASERTSIGAVHTVLKRYPLR